MAKGSEYEESTARQSRHWTDCPNAQLALTKAGVKALAGRQVDSLWWAKGKRTYWKDGQKVDSEGLKAQAEAYLEVQPTYGQVALPRFIDWTDAEDIAQNVLVTALRRGKLWQDIRQAESEGRTYWGVYYRYLINAARNHFRLVSGRAFPLANETLALLMDTFDSVEEGQLMFDLLDVLRRGMTEQAFALFLSVLEGYLQSETALRGGVSLRTVERAWKLAKDLLKQAIKS